MTDQENKQIQTANVTNGRSVDRKLFLDKYVRAQLAKNVNQAGRITPRPSGQPAPISFNQQQIWLHAQMACDVPLYNEAITIYRQGPLDVAVLERCLQEIVRRHEICRTTFDVIENETSQIPHPAPAVFPLQVVDLSRLVEAEREAEAMRLATEDVRRTFDLTTGPLIRALLVSMDDQRHRLYLTFHHLIFDAATAYRVFVPELELLYEAFSAGQPSPLPEPRIQYADFAYWQRKNLSPEVWSDHLAYWQKQLSGELSPCLWPSDRPRPPAETHRGAVERFALPQTLVQRLRAFSKQSGMSVYMTLLGGLVALLHRYTGQSDLIIGSLSAGRNRVELEDVMGYFVTPLALRFDLSADPTFRELL